MKILKRKVRSCILKCRKKSKDVSLHLSLRVFSEEEGDANRLTKQESGEKARRFHVKEVIGDPGKDRFRKWYCEERAER